MRDTCLPVMKVKAATVLLNAIKFCVCELVAAEFSTIVMVLLSMRHF